MTPFVEDGMPKINVYLPDELAEAVRAAKLPVSTICQRALEGALQGATSVREGVRTATTGGGALAGPLTFMFTNRARRVVELAHQAALDRSQGFVGTENLVLGILEEGGNLALEVMRSLDVDPADIRTEVEPLLVASRGGGDATPAQLTPLARRAVELAGQEATRMGHNYVGCEHLLLGLVAEEDGLGGRALRSMGLDLTVTRRAVVTALSGFVHATQHEPKAPVPPSAPFDEILARLERIEQRLPST